ncbi:MAG: integration host factor subunit alpha [Thermodesulfobacteriota bacterium]|nr:integration host factor subunit alpha [Thermodesulfobacteriota bacterium]
MALTKNDIVDKMYTRLNLPKKKSSEVVESMLEIIKRTLAGGEDVMISRFGRFCVRQKRGRRGRNPQTGQEMMLRPMRVVTFKCSGVLRDKLKGKSSV